MPKIDLLSSATGHDHGGSRLVAVRGSRETDATSWQKQQPRGIGDTRGSGGGENSGMTMTAIAMANNKD